jgi:hypothetical protein
MRILKNHECNYLVFFKLNYAIQQLSWATQNNCASHKQISKGANLLEAAPKHGFSENME